MTMVGYGDRDPVTNQGRVVAAVVMIASVGLFGTSSGFVAIWFRFDSTRHYVTTKTLKSNC